MALRTILRKVNNVTTEETIQELDKHIFKKYTNQEYIDSFESKKRYIRLKSGKKLYMIRGSISTDGSRRLKIGKTKWVSIIDVAEIIDK